MAIFKKFIFVGFLTAVLMIHASWVERAEAQDQESSIEALFGDLDFVDLDLPALVEPGADRDDVESECGNIDELVYQTMDTLFPFDKPEDLALKEIQNASYSPVSFRKAGMKIVAYLLQFCQRQYAELDLQAVLDNASDADERQVHEVALSLNRIAGWLEAREASDHVSMFLELLKENPDKNVLPVAAGLVVAAGHAISYRGYRNAVHWQRNLFGALASAENGAVLRSFGNRYILIPELAENADRRARAAFDKAMRGDQSPVRTNRLLNRASREIFAATDDLIDLHHYAAMVFEVNSEIAATYRHLSSLDLPIPKATVREAIDALDRRIGALAAKYDNMPGLREDFPLRGVVREEFVGTNQRHILGTDVRLAYNNATVQSRLLVKYGTRAEIKAAFFQSARFSLVELALEPQARATNHVIIRAQIAIMTLEAMGGGDMLALKPAATLDDVDFGTLSRVLGGEGLFDEFVRHVPADNELMHGAATRTQARLAKAGQFVRGTVPMSPAMKWVNGLGVLGELGLVFGFGYVAWSQFQTNEFLDDVDYEQSAEFITAQKAFDSRSVDYLVTMADETMLVIDSMNQLKQTTLADYKDTLPDIPATMDPAALIFQSLKI
jgi:hypothetical protein